jgi:hypothetical protein
MGKESASVDPPPDGARSPALAESSSAVTFDQTSVVQVLLAEFNKLRDEISGRTTAAWTLLGINATASSAIAGFVLAQKADPLLLLILPLLTPSLGLLFIDHAVNIGNIGKYINTVLKPLLREAAGDSRLLSYEEWVDKYEEQPFWRLLPFGIPLVLLFNVVPVASVLFTITVIDTPWDWALWVTGVVMTAVQVSFWMVFLTPPLRHAREKRAS